MKKGNSSRIVEAPKAQAMIHICVGTTSGRQIVEEYFARSRIQCVPYLGLVIDSAPYEDFLKRMVMESWGEEQIREAVPPSQYFQTGGPFGESFKFDDPNNRDWTKILHTARLQGLAIKPESGGCAGTPAFGRAYAEASEQELRQFLRHHIQKLTQVRDESLALLRGVLVSISTTHRGGTGTGASTMVGAIAKELVPTGSQIVLRVAMPCIFEGDERSFANSYAAVSTDHYVHRLGGSVTTRDGRKLTPPFDRIVCFFASNGIHSLAPRDARALSKEIILSHVDPSMQSAIRTREVDCTDAQSHDLDGYPSIIATESALSIEVEQPGTIDYQCTRWIESCTKEEVERFEEYIKDSTLTSTEERIVTEVVEACMKEIELTREKILSLLETNPSAISVVRGDIEKKRAAVASMTTDTIKGSMQNFKGDIRKKFDEIAMAREEKALKLARDLPGTIDGYFNSKYSFKPLIRLAILGRIIDYLDSVVMKSQQVALNSEHEREAVNKDLDKALLSLQNTNWNILQRHEPARDAAFESIALGLQASKARARQEANESVCQVFGGELKSRNHHGGYTRVLSVIPALRKLMGEFLIETRKRYETQLKELGALREKSARSFETRSAIFQRSLLHDRTTRASLDNELETARDQYGDPDVIGEYLVGAKNIDEVFEILAAFLPNHIQSSRTIPEIIFDDDSMRQQVLLLLRSVRPYTEIDEVVAEQQGLRGRRDHVTIISVPGGADGPLGELLVREGIIDDPSAIVDSVNSRIIRIYKIHLGLPFYAIKSFRPYREAHDRYLSRPGAISPYYHPDAHELSKIEPPKANLRRHVKGLLHVAGAVLSERITRSASGTITLRYEREVNEGFTVTEEQSFTEFDAMLLWLAARPTERRLIEDELRHHLDADPEGYKAALLDAWKMAGDQEKSYLTEALWDLRVDPVKATSRPKRGRPRGRRTTKKSTGDKP